MRTKIVAGNWKMNLTYSEARRLVEELLNFLNDQALGLEKKVIISPPSIYLSEVKKMIGDREFIETASQNCYFEKSGAFTGELSAEMISSVGAKYSIVGHSERRSIFNETDEIIEKKVKALLEEGIVPIFCCGEQLDDRKSENHFNVIEQQVKKALLNLNADEMKDVIIAYEPVWAIGTGETASPQQAQEIHAFIRKLISVNFSEKLADETTILYGGSCKPSNAQELFGCSDVDGGLIGGASLKGNDFFEIIKAL